MNYEELQLGMRDSVSKTMTEEDINPCAASMISVVLKTKLPGPGCRLVKSTLTYIGTAKTGDLIEVTVAVRGFHPVEKNYVLLSTSTTANGEVILGGDLVAWVPNA